MSSKKLVQTLLLCGLPLVAYANSPRILETKIDFASAFDPDASRVRTALPKGMTATPAVPESRPVVQPQANDAPLFPPGLWESLPALENYPNAKKLLAERIPGIDLAQTHVLPWDKVNGVDGADAILMQAVRRHLFAMDVFTDPAFRTSKIYFLPQDVLAKVFDKYQMRIVTTDHGTTTEGDSFIMCGLAVGNGRLELLYVRSNPKNALKEFNFTHPELDHEFQLRSRITEDIKAYGDLSVHGVKVEFAWKMRDIVRFTRIPPNHINTIVDAFGGKHDNIEPVKPLCLKSDPECLEPPTDKN